MKQNGWVEYITKSNFVPRPERVLITTAPRDVYVDNKDMDRLLCYTSDGKIDSFTHHPQFIPDHYRNISRQRTYDISFLKENVDGPVFLELPEEKTILQELASRKYDVLGISSFTWTLPWALQLAERAKADFGVREVWLGGYGIMTPDPLIRKRFDRLFWGYSESTLREAIGQEAIPLEAIKHPEIIAENTFLGHKVKIGHLFWKRGCRNKCNFCADPVFQPGGEGDFDFENVKRIIDHYKDQGCVSLHLVNQEVNPFGEVGDKVTKYLAENNLHFSMMTSIAAININGIDGVKKMKERGLSAVQLGIESLSDENLKRHRKASNLKKIEETINLLLSNRIRVNATYMVCFEEDTAESLREAKERLLNIGLTVTHFNIVIPMPGTPVYDDFNKRGLIHDWNWSHWTGERLVWKHPAISPDEARALLAELDSEVNSPLYNMNLRKQWDRAERMNQSRKNGQKDSFSKQTADEVTIQ